MSRVGQLPDCAPHVAASASVAQAAQPRTLRTKLAKAPLRPRDPSAPAPSVPTLRLIVARCAVSYTGRLGTVLPSAVRLLVLKADGSVMVHSDAGGYKPA